MGRAILGRESRDRPDRDHDRQQQPGHEQPAGPQTLPRTEVGRRWFGAFGPIEGRGIRGICHLKDRGVRVSFRESQYFAKWPGGIQRKRREECSAARARIVLKRARRPAAIPGRTTSAKPWLCGCAWYHLAWSNRHFRESPGPARELPCQTFSAT